MRGCKRGIVASLLVAGTALGAGYQLYTEGSAEALGQAAAISGRTNLTSLAWYNPAGLAGAERATVMAGSSFAKIVTDFDSAISPVLNASMYEDWRVIPHFYYVQPIADGWTGMLSINAPYGLITEWSPFWVGAPAAIYSELRAVYITPSVAWQAMDKLSVSAGFNVVDAEAKLTRTGSSLEGDDHGYGATCSAHFQALENWALGARYQSKVDLEIDGEINSFLGAEASLTLPSTFNIGVANTSIKNLSVGVDLIWTEWSVYDQLAIRSPVGTSVAPKRWDDVWSVRVGGEYALGESWALRAGYVWDESPVPDSTRSPELPGSDRQMVTGGIGWKHNNIGIDLAYAFLWADKARMGTEIASAAPALSGTFDTATHLVSVSGSYAF
jgi:long-chain fatty acid transport protein